MRNRGTTVQRNAKQRANDGTARGAPTRPTDPLESLGKRGQDLGARVQQERVHVQRGQRREVLRGDRTQHD